MAMFANIKPYEIVLDPMCGTGTIPIEISVQYPGCFAFGGDISTEAITRSAKNTEYANSIEAIKHRNFGLITNDEELKTILKPIFPVNIIKWDIKSIPIRDSCVDVIISDMPFGRRSGSYSQNANLYPKFFKECARIIRPGGRIILLTLQKKLMTRVLNKNPEFILKETNPCYMGGLELTLYYIEHTKTK